jgi:hypothetical protein
MDLDLECSKPKTEKLNDKLNRWLQLPKNIQTKMPVLSAKKKGEQI